MAVAGVTMRARSGCVRARGGAGAGRVGLAVRRGRAAVSARRSCGASPRLSGTAAKMLPSDASHRGRARAGVVTCAAKGNNGGDSWKKKYDKAVNEDLPKFWKDFRKQAGLK